MADSSIHVVIDAKDTLNRIHAGGRGPALEELARYVDGIRAGTLRAKAIDIWEGGAKPKCAFGTAVCSAVDVSDALTLNGVAITAAAAEDIAALEFDQSGTDITTATSLAAVINGTDNALIQYLVGASNINGSVALSSVADGEYITFKLASGTYKLVAGTDFAVTGTDTQDGDALVTAIHAITELNRAVFAINTSGTVRIYQRSGTSATVTLGVVGAGLTLTAMAATARVGISSLVPGVAGNMTTLASSDGTDLAVSGARLTGGTGGNVSKVGFVL